jgi:hypothetical protein
VGGGRQEQQMMGAPRQGPGLLDAFDAGQGFGEQVAIGFADVQVRTTAGGELVRLVKDDEVVRVDSLFFEAGKDARAGKRVYTDDDAVAALADERVGVAGVATADGLERQTEKLGQFALPVSNEAGGGNDQDAFQQPARQHLPDVQARHDGLAGAGVIREQVAKSLLLEHVVVNRNALVGERIDLRDFGGECGIGQVTE